MAKRVARNVVDGPCDQVAVRIGDGIPLEHRLHGHVLLLGLEAEVVGNALEDVRETDGRLRHVGAVFKTGIGEKRLHQCVDVADLLLDASERVLRACGVAPRKLKRHLDARERAADLVAHVVKEPSLPCDEGLDLVRHAVEDACEVGDLGVPAGEFLGGAGVEGAVGEAAHGAVERVEAARVEAGEKPGDE